MCRKKLVLGVIISLHELHPQPLDDGQHCASNSSDHRQAFAPAGVDVGGHQGPDEPPLNTFAAMDHQVEQQPAGLLVVNPAPKRAHQQHRPLPADHLAMTECYPQIPLLHLQLIQRDRGIAERPPPGLPESVNQDSEAASLTPPSASIALMSQASNRRPWRIER